MEVVVAFNLLLLAACGYAIWRGGQPERWTGIAFLLAAGASLLIQLQRTEWFRDFQLGLLIVDGALLLFLGAIALKANRYWPIWMTAIHASTVAVHFAKLMNPALLWPVYAHAASIASLPMLAILWWATLRHRRRLTRFGSDPPWRGSSAS